MRHASLALALLLAAGCAGVGETPSSEDAADPAGPVRSMPAVATTEPSEARVTGEVPTEIMTRLLTDAVERSGVAEDAIEVVQAMSVTWNDGSLGCPEPGMAYTQALVDGYHVVLDAAGEELDYRVNRDGGFRLCESGRTPSGG